MTVRRLLYRLGQAAVVAFACAVVVFMLVRLVPGDPARGILGPHANEESLATLNAELHLDLPLWRQFVAYFGGVLQGDLGRSVVTPSQTVAGVIRASLPITLVLVGVSTIISLLAGVTLGIVAAGRRRSVDVASRGVVALLLSSPPFLIGLVLIFVFSITFALFPPGGWGTGWPDHLKYLVLPSIALSGVLTPLIARTVRQSALDVSREQFVEAAIARGVRPRKLIILHVLPNCMLPVVTLVGINFGFMIAGAVVIEAVFGLPGFGTQLVQAVSARDYTVIQGITLVSALLVISANLIADFVYLVVDPRTRKG